MTYLKTVDNNIKALVSIPGWADDNYSGGVIKAYNSSALAFRAIELRSQAITEAELCLYDGNDKPIEKHPLLDLLAGAMSEWDQSALLQYTESDMLVYGFGIWEKVRGSNGKVIDLFRANPGLITPISDYTGIRQFNFSLGSNGKNVTLPRHDVIYFKSSYNPVADQLGIAPLKYCLIAALGEDNADKFLNSFFQNGATPATLIVSDNPMPSKTELQRQIDLWNSLFRGVENQNKTGFVYNGGKPVQVGSTIKDIDLGAVRSEMRRTITTALGVPELLITPTDQNDLTPIKQALTIFYTQTVLPRWRFLASTLTNQLVTEYPDLVSKNAYLAFDTSEVKALNESETELTTRLLSLVKEKVIKPEVAALELGYTLDDVPEEKLPVAEPNPVITGTQNNMPMDMPDNQMVVGENAKSDLDKWQTKALKAVKDNKSANVKFESKEISALEQARIRTSLEGCKTEAEVKAVFSYKPEINPADLLNGVLELARAIRENGSE